MNFLGGLGSILAPDPTGDPEQYKRQAGLGALLQLGLGTLAASGQPGAGFGSSLGAGAANATQFLQQAQQNAFQSRQEQRREDREDRLLKAETDRLKIAETERANKARELGATTAQRVSTGIGKNKGRELEYFNVIRNTPEFADLAVQYSLDPGSITTPDQVLQLGQQLSALGGVGAETPPPEPTEPLEAIIDPMTKQPVLRPRSQAIGGTPYYRPNNALSVQLADGTIITDGPPGAVGPNELTKPTVNKLQESIVTAQDRLDRVNQTLATYKPEFLQAKGLLKGKLGELTEFIGGDLSPEDKKFLSEYSEFRASAANDFNQTLRELSGAAVTDGEAKRALQGAPSPDDKSPTQFEAKAKATTKTIRRAILRANYALKNGIGTKSVDELAKLIPLDAVDAIYEARVNQIFEELGGTDDKRAEAIKRANQEFGIAR